jgi:transcriptional regulator with XRE-family HTH domain
MHPSRLLTLHEGAKPRSELALLLKFLRCRIDPDVHVLGPHVRRSERLGKRVTQEELAAAIGVSRRWYTSLESAGTTRTSVSLVERLADALMVLPEERARLLQLAVPELGQLQLRDDSAAVLETFSRLRGLTEPLWTATSIEEILTTGCERLADWFDGALLISTTRRTASGFWEYPVDVKRGRNDAAKVVEDICQLPPELHDALNAFPRLPNPGDIGRPETHWTFPVQRTVQKIYARRRLAGIASLYARVRSRSGFIGGLYIKHEFGHSYSTLDRAVLRAFAEITSYALS